MKKIILRVLVSLVAIVISTLELDAQSFKSIPEWVDNFNYYDVDSWSVASPGPFDSHKYSEKDYDIVFTRFGKLHLVAHPVVENNVYRVGRVNTTKKHTFLYGKIEVRARFNVAPGSWPCIWLVSVPDKNKDKLTAGEIDIMEYIGKFNRESFQANFHIPTQAADKVVDSQNAKRVETDITKWHIYGIEWYTDHVVLTLDGVPVHTYIKGDGPWPFDRRYYLILSNNFVTEGWAATGGSDPSKLPLHAKIDWVKYYPLINE